MKGYVRQRSKGKWEITIDTGRTDKRLRHFETIVGGKKEAQHRLAELLLNIEAEELLRQLRREQPNEYERKYRQMRDKLIES